jgi:hypothetical protein
MKREGERLVLLAKRRAHFNRTTGDIKPERGENAEISCSSNLIYILLAVAVVATEH